MVTWFGAASSKIGSAQVAQNMRAKQKIRQKQKHQAYEGKTLSGKRELPLWALVAVSVVASASPSVGQEHRECSDRG